MVRVINPMDDAAPPVFDGFPRAGLDFLRELAANNNREWFTAHKNRYDAEVKEPMEAFLTVLALRMREKLPEMDIEIHPKKSVYRIYRDIRFSKDKTPYKTHAGASFTVAGRDRKYDPGFYFHIAANEVVVSGGVYAPPPDQIKAIRNAIDRDYSSLEGIITATEFVRYFGGLAGDSLARLPRGFESGHPAENLLKMKSLYCWAEMKPEIAQGEDFDEILAGYFEAAAPLVQWLLRASGQVPQNERQR